MPKQPKTSPDPDDEPADTEPATPDAPAKPEPDTFVEPPRSAMDDPSHPLHHLRNT